MSNYIPNMAPMNNPGYSSSSQQPPLVPYNAYSSQSNGPQQANSGIQPHQYNQNFSQKRNKNI
jgi:hypothetical protein